MDIYACGRRNPYGEGCWVVWNTEETGFDTLS